MADSSDLILTYISIPGYHQQQQQKQKQQQEQINAATSRFHPYSLNTNQTSIPSSPYSDFATVSSDQKSKGSSGHGTSLASSSLGSSNSSTSISQHPPLACSTITRSRSRLPPGLLSGQFDEKLSVNQAIFSQFFQSSKNVWQKCEGIVFQLFLPLTQEDKTEFNPNWAGLALIFSRQISNSSSDFFASYFLELRPLINN